MINRLLATYIFIFLSYNIFSQPLADYPAIVENENNTYVPAFDESDVKFRLKNMDCIVNPKYNSNVKGYIKGYVLINREKSEAILGRAKIYFPIIEKILKDNNVPEDLKYLAVVESALNPHAVSPVGATGLWQFMKATGQYYGLEVNTHFDQRKDIIKSTKAAVKYLQKQYERFGSWELALAAYNSGPGNVRKAIRRSGSKNFWKLRRYLPRETRNYVPGFIGAMYLFNFYNHHNLKPNHQNLELQITDIVKIDEFITFREISFATDIPVYLIEMLNPAFKKSYISASLEGEYLILPKRVSVALSDYLQYRRTHNSNQLLSTNNFSPRYYDNPNSLYFKSIYTVEENDKIEELAEIFNCTKANLMSWNNLTDPNLSKDQELLLYYPVEIERFNPEKLKKNGSLQALPLKQILLEMPNNQPVLVDFH